MKHSGISLHRINNLAGGKEEMKFTKEWLSSLLEENMTNLKTGKKSVTINYKKLEEEIEKWRKKTKRTEES